jgi:hypothetical protein
MISRQSVFAVMSRHWLTLAFLGGFVSDYLLLNQIDDVLDNLILLFHVVVGTSSLLLLYATVTERLPARLNRVLLPLAPILMQYSFGGLLSGMLIFYGRSGDLLANAPFYILILGVIAGNEIITKRSDRLLYHLALYFVGIFSYVVLVTPVVLGVMGDLIFMLSGFVALLLVAIVVNILTLIAPHFLLLSMRRIVFTIGSMYVLINLLYYFNFIPPIPLSLTELSIVHSVERVSDMYRITYEERTWLERILFVHQTIAPSAGLVACFARVYAPTRLTTDIYHRYEYKTETGEWRTTFRFPYQISGTNKNGYRGYTQITNFSDGTWRCSVETKRGQVLGRRTFQIDTRATKPALVTVVE